MSSPCFHKLWQLNIPLTCHECGAGEGHMDDLIGRVVANRGADRTVAASAVGIILQFLGNEGSTAEPRALTRCLRGTEMPASCATSGLASMFDATGAPIIAGTQSI